MVSAAFCAYLMPLSGSLIAYLSWLVVADF